LRSTRRTALDILLKIEKQNAYAAPLLAGKITKFDSRDRRFLVELVYGVLRRRRSLDWIIERFSRFPLSRMDPTILNLLRLGTYQFLFLSRIPPHAIVFSSVEIAKSLRGKKASGFVNAVLRRISKRGKGVFDLLPKEANAEALAIRTSHPTWLVRRWINQYGFEETEALCAANNHPPPATLRVNILKTSRQELLEKVRHAPSFRDAILEHAGIARYGLKITPLSAIFETDWIDSGLVTIQDEASQLIGEIASPQSGEKILDACAGIGTKATQLMELSGNGAHLVCSDNIHWKLKQLKTSAKRLGIPHPFCVTASMIHPPLANQPIFDKVLVDAPCSNTGVIRRHPERKWRLREGDIIQMAKIQWHILNAAASRIKPGGALIYCTCSLEREEGEDIITHFVEDHPDFSLDNCGRFLSEEAEPYTHNGMFRSFPHRGEMDGFFCARLIRRTP